MDSLRLAKKVLLIGWDAADWKVIHPMLDAGEMPNLNRLVDAGTIGNIATLQPCLSPILWNSIATGKTADKHGITGFVEPNPDGPGLRLVSSTSRTTKAIWNILSQSGLNSLVLGWFASHPAEPIRGVCVSNRYSEGPPADPAAPWTLPAGCVHPADRSERLADLRLHPGELTFPEMATFIPKLQSIDLTRDNRPMLLATALSRTMSVHNAATELMASEPWDFAAVYYDALDVVGHDFMPYHPPKLSTVSQQDYDCYNGVIRALYTLFDQMLGRLLEIAGDDATVVLVSDHGFHSDHLRPHSAHAGQSPEAQAAAWHRQFGVLALCGPHIRRDERVYGANLLDVTPTILRLFGLPVGRDMDGRVLPGIFESPVPPIEPIPSWDAVPGDEFLHPTDLRQDPYASAEVVQRLVELGYLPAGTADEKQAVEIARAESKFNLASVLMHHRKAAKAKEILQSLRAAYPNQPRYALKLARVCFDLALYPEARSEVEAMESRGWRTADSDLIWIALELRDGNRDRALERIRDAQNRYPPSAALQYLLGATFVSQQQWPEAQAAFERGIELDGDFAQCHNGLAQALLMQSQFEAAGESALRAIGLLYFFPQAHYNLGRALIGLNEPQRAIRSFEIAVSQSPRFFDAHRELAKLYEQAGDPLKAVRHKRLGDGYPDLDEAR